MKVKMTRDNFEQIIDLWAAKEHLDLPVFTHWDEVQVKDIHYYAFQKNIIVNIDNTTNIGFTKVSYKEHLLDIFKPKNENSSK